MEKTHYRVIGVMSGTSLDGIDIVLAELNFNHKISYKIGHSETIPYPDNWRKRLSTGIDLDAPSLHQLDMEYTDYLGEVVNGFLKKYDLNLIDAICSHGHTIKHRPEQGITLQIGNLPKLAKILKLPVVCDFRVQDVELGGQGAPLVPIGDRLLFYQYEYCINLGGFANISTEKEGERTAFDICPVNTVFNYFMQKLGKDFDKDGNLARKGGVQQDLLQELNSLKFYHKTPPKSLGIEWVNSDIIPMIEKYNLEIPDILRTFAEHVAIQINNSIDNNSASRVFLTGGGAYNKFLVERLNSVSDCSFIIPEKELVDFKEALIFALLGVLKIRGEFNVLNSVTGAKMDHSSGRIYE
ncbi:MAG: anhydro-N-acetylmuramic acid kinase, partial [Gramella sp.]|nr:anhydro-N-acetylmuramic acid kinase [Christiangramia sp.]